MGASAAEEDTGRNGSSTDVTEPPELDADGNLVVCGECTEGVPAKAMKAPEEPTAKEREEHNATHIPFRSWCRHCVIGRAQNASHFKLGAEDEHTIPTVCKSLGLNVKQNIQTTLQVLQRILLRSTVKSHC